MKRIRLFAAVICAVLLMASCDAPRPPRNSSSAPESSSVSSEVRSDTQSSAVSVTSSESVSSDVSQPTSSEQSSETSKESSEQSDIIQAPVCGSAILYCADDGTVLYNDSADAKTAPASMTKLLTALVTLKYMDPGEVVTVGTELDLVEYGSSLCYIDYGNRLTVKDLLTGMLLNSGNDAAYTAAVCTVRTVYPDAQLGDKAAVEKFVEMMNTYAAEIGMSSSHFVNPDGWDDDDQYVTAEDVVRLSECSLKNALISEIVRTYKKDVVLESGEALSWKNTNSLLDPESIFYCPDCIGLKTGTTDYAGYCLAGACTKNGRTYITVVTECETNSDRFDLTLKLFSRIKP